MSIVTEGRKGISLRHEIEALGGNWLWFVVLGAALIALGSVALSSVVIASIVSTVALGVVMIAAGIGEIVGAFWVRYWSGFFLHLLSGILTGVVGLLLLKAPIQGTATLTLLIASFLLVGGIFSVITALSYRFAAWGWPVFGGLVDILLGLLILAEWPASSLWVIGMFVGINLIFRGVNWIVLGFAVKSLRDRIVARHPEGVQPA
ncbi:HdeD family acid-resistance protein [Isosphaeraceae bacterium EP7]